MTLQQAKKDAKAKLDRAGLPYTGIRAKTVSFEDLARGEAIFVWVRGIDFQVDTDARIEAIKRIRESIPKPSLGGYILKTEG